MPRAERDADTRRSRPEEVDMSDTIYIAALKELRAQIVAATKPVGAGPPMAS